MAPSKCFLSFQVGNRQAGEKTKRRQHGDISGAAFILIAPHCGPAILALWRFRMIYTLIPPIRDALRLRLIFGPFRRFALKLAFRVFRRRGP